MPLSPVNNTVEAGLAAIFCSRAAHRDDGAAHPDDAIQTVGPRLRGAKRPHLPAQLRGLERLLDQQRDLVDIERLVGVVIRPVLHGFHGGVDARVAGEEDHQRVRVGLLDLFQDGQTIAIGQPIVEQHEIDTFAAPLERFGGVFCFQHPVALVFQPGGQRPADQLLVVDHQNRRRLHRVSIGASPGHDPNCRARSFESPLLLIMQFERSRPRRGCADGSRFRIGRASPTPGPVWPRSRATWNASPRSKPACCSVTLQVNWPASPPPKARPRRDDAADASWAVGSPRGSIWSEVLSQVAAPVLALPG